MGFELIFHYKEEIERGVYSEEEKTKTIKIGTPNDEIPLETVAGKIFAQLARRNILVVDVEIYEFIKKKLSYKEVPEGIVIKNKRFSFDDGAGEITASTDPVLNETGSDGVNKLLEMLAANPELAEIIRGGGRQKPSSTGASSPLATPPQSPPPHSLPHEVLPTKPVRPLRHEIFDPPPWLLREAKKRGLHFTVGKQYPILKEKPADNIQAGMIYTTINDVGIKQSLASIHFNPVPVKLEGRFIEGDFETPTVQGGPNLSWDGLVEDGPLQIR